MTGRVDTRQLRPHVVRLETSSGWGTGFFVAPGLVLTCAHVVGDDAAVSVVADPSVADSSLPGMVVAQSAPPESGALWPFPDLAVVRLETTVDHPCVLLSGSDPAGGDLDCQAWGFPEREWRVAPGSPASFRFEGVEGDGFLTLKSGTAVQGLSGAPLVCPGRRAVVGVMTATRGATSDLGGYAAPVAALWEPAAGVPAGLAEIGEQIRAVNRPVLRASRARWHRVLPVDGADEAVDRFWAPFVRQPKSSPAALLQPDHGVVPYLFREGELTTAAGWCEAVDGPPLALRQVIGRGGTGKTRFGIELCERLAPAGWVAGWWRRGGDAERVPLPRLVVVDYVEAVTPEDLKTMLDGFRRHATEMAPVRVLLLTRTGAGRTVDPLGALRGEASAVLQSVLDASIDSTDPTAGLTVDQRGALFTQAVDRFADAWQVSAPVGLPDPLRLLAGTRYAAPLEVLFEAFDRVLSGPDWAPGTRPPVDRVLAHERKYWKATVPGGSDEYRDVHGHAVALVTLAGAGSAEEAGELLAVLPGLVDDPTVRQVMTGWLAGLYDGPLVCNPLRPDRLGEAAVGHLLAEIAGGGSRLLGDVFGLSSDDQVARCLDTLARLTLYDPAAGEDMRVAFARAHFALVIRAEQQASGTPDRPGRTSILAGLLRLLGSGSPTTVARQLVRAEPGNTTYQRDLSVSYERLAVDAQQAGRRGEANGLLTMAVKIRRSLHRREPDRVDLVEELAITLVLFGELAQEDDRRNIGAEVRACLAPFGERGLLTAQGHRALGWVEDW